MSEAAISVAIRTRPLLLNEHYPRQEITFLDNFVKTANREFCYDHVFPENSSNAAVYKSAVASKIPNIFEGYNVTILAYGSTGSGKTYTMGTDYSPVASSSSDMGIIPQGLNEIFRVLEAEKELKSFSVKVSFIELYQEIIYDLCHPNAKVILKRDPKLLNDRNTPKVQEDKDGNFKVSNLTEESVNCIEEALAILVKGSALRHTATTAKNAKSSRSHAIFTVYIEQVDKATFHSKSAKFQLVDLAGSERMSTSKTVGLQAKEGTRINLSLLSLSKVIVALSEHKSHIPYRESKLTRMLQDSLGGNSHTVMIACVNPSATSYEETLSTLRYAENARNIKNRPKVNVDPPAVQVIKLKQQVQELQAELFKLNPLRNLNMTGNLNSEGRAVELLENAYSEINNLNLKVIQVEDVNTRIAQKIKSIYETIKTIIAELTPVVAADITLKPQLDKLEELQSEYLDFVIQDNINYIVDTKNSTETVEESESCESLSVDKELSDSEIDQIDECTTPMKSEADILREVNDMAERQKNSAKRLEDLDWRYSMTETLTNILQIADENTLEEEQARTLVQKIKSLVKEKTDLEAAMHKDKLYINENKNKIGKYEEDIKKLQDELCKIKKSLLKHNQQKAKVENLKIQMEDMRKLKVKYMKDVKECEKATTRIQKQKNTTIRQITREKNRIAVDLSRTRTRAEKRLQVLQSQCKLQKIQIINLQKKQMQPRQTGVKTKQSQLNLEEWIDNEIKCKVEAGTVEYNFEDLDKKVEQIRQDIKRIEELSPSQENQETSIEKDELKVLLQIELGHINDMKKAQIAENKGHETSGHLFNELTDVSEANNLVKHLFNKCVGAEVESTKQLRIVEENFQRQEGINKSSEVKIESLSAEVNSLKEAIKNKESEHQAVLENMKIKYTSKIIQMHVDFKTGNYSPEGKSETDCSQKGLKRSLEPEDFGGFDTLKEKYKKVCTENERLHKKLFLVKKGDTIGWLNPLIKNEILLTESDGEDPIPSTSKETKHSKSMLSEYLSSDDEQVPEDPNDPDYRGTPRYQQVKRRKLEKAAAQSTAQLVTSDSVVPMDTTENESASIIKPYKPCNCEGDCKTQRCRCQRKLVSCSEDCACITAKCSNQSSN